MQGTGGKRAAEELRKRLHNEEWEMCVCERVSVCVSGNGLLFKGHQLLMGRLHFAGSGSPLRRGDHSACH